MIQPDFAGFTNLVRLVVCVTQFCAEGKRSKMEHARQTVVGIADSVISNTSQGAFKKTFST